MQHTARCEHHAVCAEGVGNIACSMILTFFHFSALVCESCHPRNRVHVRSRARARSIRSSGSERYFTFVAVSARFFLACRKGIAEAFCNQEMARAPQSIHPLTATSTPRSVRNHVQRLAECRQSCQRVDRGAEGRDPTIFTLMS